VVASISTALVPASPTSGLSYHRIGSQGIVSVRRLGNIVFSSKGARFHLREDIGRGCVGGGRRRKWRYRWRRREPVRIVKLRRVVERRLAAIERRLSVIKLLAVVKRRLVVIERWLAKTGRIALHKSIRVAIEASERRASGLERHGLLAQETCWLRLHRLGAEEACRLSRHERRLLHGRVGKGRCRGTGAGGYKAVEPSLSGN